MIGPSSSSKTDEMYANLFDHNFAQIVTRGNNMALGAAMCSTIVSCWKHWALHVIRIELDEQDWSRAPVWIQSLNIRFHLAGVYKPGFLEQVIVVGRSTGVEAWTLNRWEHALATFLAPLSKSMGPFYQFCRTSNMFAPTILQSTLDWKMWYDIKWKVKVKGGTKWKLNSKYILEKFWPFLPPSVCENFGPSCSCMKWSNNPKCVNLRRRKTQNPDCKGGGGVNPYSQPGWNIYTFPKN